MCADMPEGANGNFRAGRIESNAAAIGVSNGYHVVHIWESWQQFIFDAPHRILNRWSDALHRCCDAEDVLRPNGSISIAKTVEAIAIERRFRPWYFGR